MISDYDILLEFNKKPVNNEMVEYLVTLTNQLIKTPQNNEWDPSVPKLITFIKRLVIHSNVQTATLMATAVYLTKLKDIIPSDVCGIETTIHRIFLGCLILASKILNDTSPMNKYWAKYTEGLLNIREVNTIERELLEYFQWNIQLDTKDLIQSLRSLLDNHKLEIIKDMERTDLLYFNAPMSVSPYRKSSLLQYNSNNSNNSNNTVATDNIIRPSSRSISQMSIPSISSSSTFSNIESIFEAEEAFNPYMVPLTESLTIESPVKANNKSMGKDRGAVWSMNLKKSNYLKSDKLKKLKNNLFRKA